MKIFENKTTDREQANKLLNDMLHWLHKEHPNANVVAVMWALTKVFAIAICTASQNEEHLLDGIRVATDGLRSSTTNLWVKLHK
jgi:hypothetical protein